MFKRIKLSCLGKSDPEVVALVSQINELIDAANDSVKAVEEGLSSQLMPLSSRLMELSANQVAQKYGFRQGDLLRATPAFLRIIESRLPNSLSFRDWTAEQTYSVLQIGFETDQCAISCHAVGDTGGIPFEVVADMRKAYLDFEGSGIDDPTKN